MKKPRNPSEKNLRWSTPCDSKDCVQNFSASFCPPVCDLAVPFDYASQISAGTTNCGKENIRRHTQPNNRHHDKPHGAHQQACHHIVNHRRAILDFPTANDQTLFRLFR